MSVICSYFKPSFKQACAINLLLFRWGKLPRSDKEGNIQNARLKTVSFFVEPALERKPEISAASLLEGEHGYRGTDGKAS